MKFALGSRPGRRRLIEAIDASSADAIAKAARVPKQRISDLRNGRTTEPTVTVAYRLWKATGIPIEAWAEDFEEVGSKSGKPDSGRGKS